ncbi:hypothetical protein KRR39_11040 [Nocardioides panacis]|uniref:ATP-binding cassette domain-containing protein n=1 Tax=Nocardioides panacis TaxID=2849501 RepID=A0A975T3H7_9ACTN|nr:hypothetical protein [Nocardioides panacis]QWZ10209.1 hypothetical protein KRR39_11040 [Nocardioides panacis]
MDQNPHSDLAVRTVGLVRRGEIFGVLGPNGAGKPAAGSALAPGASTRSWPRR